MLATSCSVCGGEGANQYWSNTENGEDGSWYHLICLAKHRLGTEATTLRMPRSAARGYLAAMIDGEGHVRKDDGRTEIINNDLSVISACEQAARWLGIKTKVRVSCRKDGYMPTYAIALLGGAETRKKLLRLPIVCPYKRKHLGRK